MLQTLAALLAATVIAVPISRRLGFGSIFGYLVAGAVIGPSGLRLVTDIDQIAEVSRLGVVMLLFLIGLELRPHRVWVLRRAIFGLGFGQMVPSALLLAGLARLAGLDWAGAAALGAALALSSTAIVLPMLAERGLLPTTAGRDSFAVLLFQDVAFIPLVALIPLLAGAPMPARLPWVEVLRALAAATAILVGGSVLVRPLFRLVGGARLPEVFTATALLLVVGTATLADWAGLSMSLGAFMAGVMLSDSEYRHELQADIAPFEGLLLGFFFISIGMSTDLGLVLRAPGTIAAAVMTLIVAKAAVAFAVGLIRRRSLGHALRFSLALSEGSEFSFVLFAAAVSAGVLTREVAELATLAAALSMATAPILFAASEALLAPRLGKRREQPAYDRIEEADAPVIICGFGRVGQIVGRVLRMQRIGFTALDKNPTVVDVVRRYGGKVYFGDAARPEVMRAAGADKAHVLVLALGDMDAALAVAAMVRRQFPHLAILARAHNRRHAQLLMNLGITAVIRETFYSSLRLSELTLERLGVPKARAMRAIELFRVHDEQTLAATRTIADDERQLIQSAQQAAKELMELFESDQAEAPADE
jgi:monovalent cation:proton antiporter-2 (CPA2) family protein